MVLEGLDSFNSGISVGQKHAVVLYRIRLEQETDSWLNLITSSNVLTSTMTVCVIMID